MFDMMRREFITLVGGAAAWPLAARAQQAVRLRRIGILLYSQQELPVIRPCLQDELVRLNPDVIFSFGGEQAPIVKQATASTPIVVVVSNDPVASGLVASLARPGGNITGLTYVHDQLAGKAVELLKDAAPWVSRVATLWNPNHTDREYRETQCAARTLSIELQSLEVREPRDFDGAFQAATRERAEALIVVGARIMFLHRQQIGGFAARNGLFTTMPPWGGLAGTAKRNVPRTIPRSSRSLAYVGVAQPRPRCRATSAISLRRAGPRRQVPASA